MTSILDPASWVSKLHIEVTDDGVITIEWDADDSDLDYWNSLLEEGQRKFILDALDVSFKNLGLTTNDT